MLWQHWQVSSQRGTTKPTWTRTTSEKVVAKSSRTTQAMSLLTVMLQLLSKCATMSHLPMVHLLNMKASKAAHASSTQAIATLKVILVVWTHWLPMSMHRLARRVATRSWVRSTTRRRTRHLLQSMRCSWSHRTTYCKDLTCLILKVLHLHRPIMQASRSWSNLWLREWKHLILS